MSRPKWQVKLINRFFDKIFLFARMTRLPIVGPLIYRRLFKKEHITFIPVNESLAHHEHVALPSDIVRHFIMRSEYIWIKDKCVCRAAEGCASYPVDLGCMYLGNAARKFNPDLGRQASVGEALEHLRRCADAGLVHMIGVNRMDSLLLGCAPSDTLMTICNCCECCCFFRILPDLDNPIKKKIRGLPCVEITVTDDCVGCGGCEEACFVRAVTMSRGRAHIGGDCIRCGKCVRACPRGAIRMRITDPVFVDASIGRIAGASFGSGGNHVFTAEGSE